MGKNTVVTLRQMKERGEKISQVTCYDYSMARLVDAAGINMILVGDSLGMTMQGYKDTLPVTVDEMIIYGRSVVRGVENTLVVSSGNACPSTHLISLMSIPKIYW